MTQLTTVDNDAALLLRRLLAAPEATVADPGDQEAAIARLRNAGVVLHTHRRLLSLVHLPDRIDPVLFAAMRTSRWLGHTVRCFDEVDSTSTYLREQCPSGAGAGLVVVADHQTQGRGRGTRRWMAPAGTGLLWSVLLETSISAFGAVSAFAVAAADAIEAQTGIKVEVKWPNDLLVGPCKLGGILAERDAEGRLIVGCGINVHLQRDVLPPELAGRVTSLALETSGRVPLRVELLSGVLALLEPLLEALREHNLEEVVGLWRGRCRTLGQAVRVERGTDVFWGVAEDVDTAGGLRVRRDDTGKISVVRSGDVTEVRIERK